jgi:hypothetical protein
MNASDQRLIWGDIGKPVIQTSIGRSLFQSIHGAGSVKMPPAARLIGVNMWAVGCTIASHDLHHI